METDGLYTATSSNEPYLHDCKQSRPACVKIHLHHDRQNCSKDAPTVMCLTCRANSGTQGVDQKPSYWGGQKKMSEPICVHMLQIYLAASVGVRRIRHFTITWQKTDTSNSSAEKNPWPNLCTGMFQPSLQSFSRSFLTHAHNLKNILCCESENIEIFFSFQKHIFVGGSFERNFRVRLFLPFKS